VALDLPSILVIERASFSDPWTEEMFLSEMSDHPSQGSHLHAFSYVAKNSLNHLVGYIFFWILSDEFQLMNLGVDVLWRNKGIGAALIRRALYVGEQSGIRVGYLEVRASNAAARSLYEKIGFKKIGVRKNYYTHPREDAILYQMVVEVSPCLELVSQR